MPLYEIRSAHPPGAITLALWRLTEPESFFLERMDLYALEREELLYLKGHRRVEMLTARYLLHEMTGGIKRIPCLKDEHGKPFLKGFDGHISLSHSKDWIAAMTGDRPVGVDIQLITPKIERIKSKFMREEEIVCLDTTHLLEHLHVFWGAKEALYKAYGKRELDFRGHIFVNPFAYSPQGGSCRGSVRKDDFMGEYQLQYENMGDYILVYAWQEA